MKSLKIKEVMTCSPHMVRPTQTVEEAARAMKTADCGVLPVGEPDKVIGMITDRDITIRVIAEGKDPARTQVQEVMTRKVYTCEEDDDIEDAAEEMRERGVARLVITRGKKATGILSMADLLQSKGDRQKSDKVLHTLLKPAGKKAAGGSASSCGSCDD